MSEPVSTLTATRRRGPRAHLDVLGLGALLLVLLACYAQLAPGLLKLGSITVLSAQFLPLVLAATGQTAIMLVGGVDLSLGTVVALARMNDLTDDHFRRDEAAFLARLGKT